MEFRVYSYNISYIKVAAVSVFENTLTFTCASGLSLGSAGQLSGQTCLSNSVSSNGNLSYGPYLEDLPGRPSQAGFFLHFNGVDNSSNTIVAAVDIHDATTDEVVASASIPASQASGYQTIYLDYDWTLHAGHRLETRVYTWGYGQVQTNSIQIIPK